MCNVCNVCNALTNKALLHCRVRRINPTALRWDLLIYPQHWRRDLGTPEGQLEQPQASGTEPQALLGTVFPLQGGVRGVLFFCRVVRLLERAEESCEGLKHGYYDLPCVHFLIFLCHDIKNKIDRLFFLKNNGLRPIIKIIHNYFSLSNKRKNLV